jgi:hypothetical protein
MLKLYVEILNGFHRAIDRAAPAMEKFVGEEGFTTAETIGVAIVGLLLAFAAMAIFTGSGGVFDKFGQRIKDIIDTGH